MTRPTKTTSATGGGRYIKKSNRSLSVLPHLCKCTRAPDPIHRDGGRREPQPVWSPGAPGCAPRMYDPANGPQSAPTRVVSICRRTPDHPSSTRPGSGRGGPRSPGPRTSSRGEPAYFGCIPFWVARSGTPQARQAVRTSNHGLAARDRATRCRFAPLFGMHPRISEACHRRCGELG